jgi:hypothetical protein
VVSIQASPVQPELDFDLLKTEKGRETAERFLIVWRETGGGFRVLDVYLRFCHARVHDNCVRLVPAWFSTRVGKRRPKIDLLSLSW